MLLKKSSKLGKKCNYKTDPIEVCSTYNENLKRYTNHFGLITGQTLDDKRIIQSLKRSKNNAHITNSSVKRCFDLKSWGENKWNISMFVSCRESFQLYTDGKVRKFVFLHKTNKGRAIAAFIKKVEDKLELAEDCRCEFNATQCNNVTCVKIPSWWSDHHMRRSLLTILIRIGTAYLRTKDNFEDVLYSHSYTQNTKFAIERFMEGYTHYTGNLIGWVWQFQYNGSGWASESKSLSKELICKLLVKPE